VRALAALGTQWGLPAGAIRQLGILLEALRGPDAPTSVHDPGDAVDVHIADSLVGLEVADLRSAATIADLGAGAGLPALVLAAARPGARVVAIESVQRKCAFIERAARAMRLSNVEVVCGRAETWRDGMGRCDAICARALAALPVLCEYAAPLLRRGGVLVAWKGQVDPGEAADGDAAAAALGLTGADVRAVEPYPGSRHRRLYVFRKRAPTPPGFPRRPGMAAKRPIGRS
jgi:16S rRNA (guanine527-N7)-methyltransferase